MKFLALTFLLPKQYLRVEGWQKMYLLSISKIHHLNTRILHTEAEEVHSVSRSVSKQHSKRLLL
jgi:hypothetical protein